MSRYSQIFRNTFRLIILTVFFFGVISNTLVVAKSPEEAGTKNNLSMPKQKLSTPELIEQAFANGEITAEQRIRYLAYALYDYESLPIQFHGSVGWSGTPYVWEIDKTLNAVNSGDISHFSSALQHELNLLSVQSTAVCDREDGPNSTESANFHLNYDTVGGELTIENYKTSLETSFATEVTSYGWAKPPFCTSGTGLCTITNPWEKYPVQVSEMPDPYIYGYVTLGGGSYNGQVGDNPNTLAIETTATATCMVLNRDFSPFPGSPQESLDATVAHEFVHALHLGIVNSSFIEDLMWTESSAAYMEDEVFDAINDNYQYLWPQFSSCLGEYPAGPPNYYEYSNWLFFRYASEQNGGTNIAGGGEDIMQAFWINVASGETGLAAYNHALGIKGANLADTFHNYAIASRFTKSCPTASPYCFEEAQGYVNARGVNSNHGAIGSIGNSYIGSLENNYAINWIGLPTNGTYSITLENFRKHISGGPIPRDYCRRYGQRFTYYSITKCNQR